MERISKNCRVLAETLQLTKEYADLISDAYVDTIELAAPVCDIRKRGSPDRDLTKDRSPDTGGEPHHAASYRSRGAYPAGDR